MATPKKAVKQSKYELNLISKLEGQEDINVLAEISFRKASAIIEQQIAGLKYDSVNLEIKIGEKSIELTNATYNTNFSIENYDTCVKQLKDLEDDLADLEYTLAARTKLLASWN